MSAPESTECRQDIRDTRHLASWSLLWRIKGPLEWPPRLPHPLLSAQGPQDHSPFVSCSPIPVPGPSSISFSTGNRPCLEGRKSCKVSAGEAVRNLKPREQPGEGGGASWQAAVQRSWSDSGSQGSGHAGYREGRPGTSECLDRQVREPQGPQDCRKL